MGVEKDLNEKYVKLLKPYHSKYVYGRKNLYHYTDLNNLISIIENNELWISRREYINDIEEADYSSMLLEEVFESENIKNEIRKEFRDYLNRNKQYVFCCSTEQDIANQWMAYSNIDGYCICFDKTKLGQFLNISNLFTLSGGKVNYEKETTIRVLELLTRYFSEVTSKSNTLLYEIWHQQKAFDLFMSYYGLIKKENYRYENEYRIIINYDKDVLYRGRNGLMVPYIKVKNQKIKLPITKIIIGPKIKDEKTKLGLMEFLHKNHYSNVDIVFSEMYMR